MGRVKCRGRGLSWRKYHPALCLTNLFPSNGFFLYITCLITCRICHVLAVRRLRWRRKRDSDDSSCLQLASCGLDHSVRIFNMAVLAWLAVTVTQYYLEIIVAYTRLYTMYAIQLESHCARNVEAITRTLWFLLMKALPSCTRNELSLGFCWMTAQPVQHQ